MSDPDLLKALARNNTCYVCVGCLKEVDHVGAYMAMEPPQPAPFPSASRVCTPCSDRIGRCDDFFAEVSARVPDALRDEVMTAFARSQGLTLQAFQSESINIYAASAESLPPAACNILDMVVGVKPGTHMMARVYAQTEKSQSKQAQ